MNNLPTGTTQDMIDAQCAPIAKGVCECDTCAEDFMRCEMVEWMQYSFIAHAMADVLLCPHCVPKCQWIMHDPDRNPCGRIQSPNAQGPWCAEHEKEAEALDAAESEEGNDQKAKG